MLLLKGCPRCGGDLIPEQPGELVCLQCAYRPRGSAAAGDNPLRALAPSLQDHRAVASGGAKGGKASD